MSETRKDQAVASAPVVLEDLYRAWAGFELCIHPDREQYGGGCWGLLPWDVEGWLREPCVSCRYEKANHYE